MARAAERAEGVPKRHEGRTRLPYAPEFKAEAVRLARSKTASRAPSVGHLLDSSWRENMLGRVGTGGMASKRFSASVQYGDWKGTSAADDADSDDAGDWLRARGNITDDEFVVGVTMWAGENRGQHQDPVSVTFLLTTPGTFDGVKARIANHMERSR